MALESGQQLLHYRLTEKIGEGGMGVVWKAVDTTLDREVAIKILPDGFAADPERLARFAREARLLASLNHPNVAAIYGIHEVPEPDSSSRTCATHFLAMELIDGEDLQQRMTRGALPIEEALRVALEIAQGFEAAHARGIVHRDLKPANVRLSLDGGVKVLDFGLAKALAPDVADDSAAPSMSPTMTSTGTVAGMILGTASYMSPEQAKGKPVDRRADIWSFGVVLFELFSGRRLFEGESISETLAAVLLKDPDWSALPSNTPAKVRRLLQRCLTRDPKNRLQDIGEARIALLEALAGDTDVAIAVALVPPLAVTGIGFALGRETTSEVPPSLMEIGLVSGGLSIPRGAFLLFLTNLIGIVAVGIAVFAAHRYGRWKAALVGLVFAVFCSIFLIEPLGEAFRRLYVKSIALRTIATLATKRPDTFSREAKIESIFVTYQDDQLYVYINSFAPVVATTEFQLRTDLFQQYLSAELKEPVHVRIRVSPVEMLRFMLADPRRPACRRYRALPTVAIERAHADLGST